MPRDVPAPDVEYIPREEDIEYFCARCGTPVTRGRWEISLNGGFEHVFFNPAGVVFRVLCFKEAPGVICVGPADSTFTWFRGYDWRIGVCRSCHAHLGWRYEGEAEPRIFFGLIREALTTKLR